MPGHRHPRTATEAIIQVPRTTTSTASDDVGIINLLEAMGLNDYMLGGRPTPADDPKYWFRDLLEAKPNA